MKKTNIKRTILWSLILAGLITAVMPIHAIDAESKTVRYSKKAAKVTWRTAEVVGGILLALLVGAYAKDGFKDADGKTDCILPLICSGLTVSLLGNGLSGLNDELEMVKNIKRLYKLAVKERKNGKKEYEKNSIELSTIS